MITKPIVLWDVDTQVDFMDVDGELYVGGAEDIKPALAKLRKLKDQYANNVLRVKTADAHLEGDAELSKTPDFITTFPNHCMRASQGVDFVEETQPVDPVIIDNLEPASRLPDYYAAIKARRDIVLYKNRFDIFSGSAHAGHVLTAINPFCVFVYGVATNVCVDCAVRGLRTRGHVVFVVLDAIKELPKIPVEPLVNKWLEIGVKFCQIDPSIDTEVGKIVKQNNRAINDIEVVLGHALDFVG